MQPKFFTSEVVQNLKLNYKFNLVRFKLVGQTFAFKPGQFVTLKVSDSFFRCYSIFSPSTLLPYWEILVDITPGGPGTTFVSRLKIKDEIQTLTPSGTFTNEGDENTNFVFAATGCGLAPLKPMVDQLLNSVQKSNVYLLWGLRYKKDIALQEVLKNWAKDHQFHYDIVLSQPDTTWLGKKGHLIPHIQKIIAKLPVKKTSIYLSGNNEFIKDSLENLSGLKFPTRNIYFEGCS